MGYYIDQVGGDKMIDKRIMFDEAWNNQDGETVLYFTAPKEMLWGDYPEAVSMEISLEFPTDSAEPEYVDVSISPTRYIKEDDNYEDYDWHDISLPYVEINELIEYIKNFPDIEYIDVAVSNRKSIAVASSFGESVFERKPKDPKACAEIEALANAIYHFE